jgi:ADP-heptose:LPS heptosyltransferase/predicted SAM-dependent methyltransferase
MTWDPKAPYVPEVKKCRPRLIGYCEGQGLDIGCGAEKIKTSAIGLDIGKANGSQADLAIDLENGLTLFADGTFDYVFSSHCLEDLSNPVLALQEWWRVIRPGGNLVLYLPHKDHYPRMGQPGANPAHKNDFEPADIFRMLNEFASYKTLHMEVHSEGDEYSFDLVVQKIADFAGVPPLVSRAPMKNEKTACVVRYGGIGDIIIATPVIRHLKQEGYHVTVNTSENGLEILRHNPNVDRIIYQGSNEVANAELEEYWERLSKNFDRFINLSGTCEEALLQIKRKSPDYDLPDKERRLKYGLINYYDYALKAAGIDARGENGEIFLSNEEELNARIFRAATAGRFIVIWALGGSGPHKRFPFFNLCMEAFRREHPEVLFITVGGAPEKLLELCCDDDPNFLHRAGRWTIRNVAAAVKYADLVVGPETGVLNIAGCFPTPKICMLTHSSWANLCKYWENDYSVQSRAACSPCHRMVFLENDCPKDERFRVCQCASEFDPSDILPKMKEVYRKWRRQNSTLIVLPGSASTVRKDGSPKDRGNSIR